MCGARPPVGRRLPAIWCNKGNAMVDELRLIAWLPLADTLFADTMFADTLLAGTLFADTKVADMLPTVTVFPDTLLFADTPLVDTPEET